MPGRDEHASGHWGSGPRGRISGAVLLIAALTRTLEAESDRLSLWILVLFAGGILIYYTVDVARDELLILNVKQSARQRDHSET